MGFLLLFSALAATALGQTNSKQCLAGWASNMADSCTMYTDLQACQAELAACATHAYVVLVKSPKNAEPLLWSTNSQTTSFNDLENAVRAHFGLNQGHSFTLTYRHSEDMLTGSPQAGNGVPILINSDAKLGALWALPDRFQPIALTTDVLTEAPTAPPTQVPTSMPTPLEDQFQQLHQGGWVWALNLATSDGNLIHYKSTEFWESSTLLGGASDQFADRMTRDYKNSDVFANFKARELLVVVHEQGNILGYRSWNLNYAHCTDINGCPLISYFRGSGCDVANGEAGIVLRNDYQMTKGTTGGDVSQIDSKDGVIYQPRDLYTNTATGNVLNANDHDDWTRISNKASATEILDNRGWGLGCSYDTAHSCATTWGHVVVEAHIQTNAGYNWGKGNTGGMIGSDQMHNGDVSGNPRNPDYYTSPSGLNYDYAILLRGAAQVGPNMDEFQIIHGRGWTWAMNIETSDGNCVHYKNVDFWESPTALGGASDVYANRMIQDYKDPNVFSTFDAKELLVVVHLDGQIQGYRGWNLNAQGRCGQAACPLINYFTGSGCDVAAGGSNVVGRNDYTMTVGSTGGDVANIVGNEGVIKQNRELYSNTATGNVHNANEHDDFTRISNKSSAGEILDNRGWGLGCAYDTGHFCNQSFGHVMADAYLQTASGYNWNVGNGGGMIGTDMLTASEMYNNGNGRSPSTYTQASGVDYDYAILVR